jgi:hypothetical protein
MAIIIAAFAIFPEDDPANWVHESTDKVVLQKNAASPMHTSMQQMVNNYMKKTSDIASKYSKRIHQVVVGREHPDAAHSNSDYNMTRKVAPAKSVVVEMQTGSVHIKKRKRAASEDKVLAAYEATLAAKDKGDSDRDDEKVNEEDEDELLLQVTPVDGDEEEESDEQVLAQLEELADSSPVDELVQGPAAKAQRQAKKAKRRLKAKVEAKKKIAKKKAKKKVKALKKKKEKEVKKHKERQYKNVVSTIHLKRTGLHHLKEVISGGKSRVKRRFMRAKAKVYRQTGKSIEKMQRTPQGRAAIKSARKLREVTKTAVQNYRAWKLGKEIDFKKKKEAMKEKNLHHKYHTAYRNMDDTDKYSTAIRRLHDDRAASYARWLTKRRYDGENWEVQGVHKGQHAPPISNDDKETVTTGVASANHKKSHAQKAKKTERPGDATKAELQAQFEAMMAMLQKKPDSGSNARGTLVQESSAVAPASDTESAAVADVATSEVAADKKAESEDAQHAMQARDAALKHAIKAQVAADKKLGKEDVQHAIQAQEAASQALKAKIARQKNTEMKDSDVSGRSIPSAYDRVEHEVHANASPEDAKMPKMDSKKQNDDSEMDAQGNPNDFDPVTPPVKGVATAPHPTVKVHQAPPLSIAGENNSPAVVEKVSLAHREANQDLHDTKAKVEAHMKKAEEERLAAREKRHQKALEAWHHAQKDAAKRALPLTQKYAAKHKKQLWAEVWNAFENRHGLGAASAAEREHLVHPHEQRKGKMGAQGIPRVDEKSTRMQNQKPTNTKPGKVDTLADKPAPAAALKHAIQAQAATEVAKAAPAAVQARDAALKHAIQAQVAADKKTKKPNMVATALFSTDNSEEESEAKYDEFAETLFDPPKKAKVSADRLEAEIAKEEDLKKGIQRLERENDDFREMYAKYKADNEQLVHILKDHHIEFSPELAP